MNLTIGARYAATAVLLGTAMYAAAARAGATPQESWPQVWLNPGIYSHHFDSSKGLRNNNIGFGAEVMLANDHVLMAGSFINSNRARTHFAAYEWRPLHWRFSGVNVSAGIALGAFDGYPNYRNGAWFVAPLPLLSIEGKTLEELRAFNKDDVLDLLGIPLGPVRIKCALLPLKVLKAGVYGIKGWPDEEE